MNIKYILLFILSNTLNAGILESNAKAFSNSFIQTFDPESSFIREYNSYILKRTEKTFLDLEERLKNENFNLIGRNAIIGFQEEAIAQYTTDWQRHYIADEAIIEKNGGIVEQAKNIFGFMTAFLLKDAQYMQTKWHNSTPQVFNICAKDIKLFKDECIAFQKHAFGKDYDAIICFRDKIEQALYLNDLKSILSYLIDFWKFLEHNFSKTGSGELACTQDVLFSIAYAQTLIDSSLPLTKIFIGPDITYPIEVLSFQHEKATAHAQKFLNDLQEHLKPVDNKKTAYIFSSYVDGVGKSTLLNNILNYQKYGTEYNLYQRCDNSSSQEATLFELKENVVLCDLPGQVSHTVFKSDGYVFVDIETVKNLDKNNIQKILDYANANKNNIAENFTTILNSINPKAPNYESNDYVYLYAQNCINLELNNPEYIAFNFEEDTYIIDKNLKNLKILVPLSNAHSTGLKSVYPEQMLFTNGLSLPMSYDSFLNKLVDSLKACGVKNIIFIDFMSMYPRTSRESVRVNFVMQYLKKIFADKYCIENSFYNPRVYKGQEIFHLLKNKLDSASKNLYFETLLRTGINYIIESNQSPNVISISGKKLEEKLSESIEWVKLVCGQDIYTKIYDRLNTQVAHYEDLYSLDYIYESLILFNPALAELYVKVIKDFFTNKVNDDDNYLKNIWHNFDIKNSDIAEFESIDSNCKDVLYFKKFAKPLRAQLYAILSNMIFAQSTANDNFYIENYYILVPPFSIEYDVKNKKLKRYQKNLSIIDTEEFNEDESLEDYFHAATQFHINLEKAEWAIFDEKFLHLTNWQVSKTNGIYAYGFLHKGLNAINGFVLKSWQELYIKGINAFIPTTLLYNYLQSEEGSAILANDLKKLENLKTLNLDDPKIEGIRFWARAIATLEMLIKDPESKVFVRFGNKSDFIASIRLLETVTLPFFFDVNINGNLFDDYTSIQPIIPWDLINNMRTK